MVKSKEIKQVLDDREDSEFLEEILLGLDDFDEEILKLIHE